jgi:hypothetical protein
LHASWGEKLCGKTLFQIPEGREKKIHFGLFSSQAPISPPPKKGSLGYEIVPPKRPFFFGNPDIELQDVLELRR